MCEPTNEQQEKAPTPSQLVECPECKHLQSRSDDAETPCHDCFCIVQSDSWITPKEVEICEGTPVYQSSNGYYGAMVIVNWQGHELENVLVSEHLLGVTLQLSKMMQARKAG